MILRNMLRAKSRGKPAIVLACVGVLVAIGGQAGSAATPGASWSMHGQGITNWRYQPNEKQINADNAGSLKPVWATSLGEISATPAVVDGVAYVPDWSGYLDAVDTTTGAVIWRKSVSTLADAAGTWSYNFATAQYFVDGSQPVVSRSSPAVSGNAVVIGTQQMQSADPAVGPGAELIAVDKATGSLLWRRKLDDHYLSIETQSPTIYNGVVYVGVASIEENGVDCGAPGSTTCNFRGSLSAVNLADGSVIWKTYTISPAQSAAGYSGAAVWGSSPAIDVKRNAVYLATGNNYSASQATSDCVAAATTPEAISNCEAVNGVGNNVDAVISLDLTTGGVKWIHKVQGFDAWTTACIGLPTACPSPNGPDYDFGQGAMLIPTKAGDIVAAGEKAGIMWGLNADTGATVWKTFVGPGSSLGGLEWGSATDGKRIYFAVANFNFGPSAHYPMVNPPKGTPAFSDAGSWGAIDPATGQILWQTADPNGAIDLGPVSVANGVVYAASMGSLFPPFDNSQPTMFALDAANGKQLWSFASGSVNAGPAIVNGTVYWGSGYTHLALGSTSNKLYAFSRNGK